MLLLLNYYSVSNHKITMFSSCCRCVNKKALKDELSENDDEQVSPATNAADESKAQGKSSDNRSLMHIDEPPIDTTLMVIIEENDAKEDDVVEVSKVSSTPVEVINQSSAEAAATPAKESDNDTESESVKSSNGDTIEDGINVRKVNDMTDEEKQQLLDQNVKCQEDGKFHVQLYFLSILPYKISNVFVIDTFFFIDFSLI